MVARYGGPRPGMGMTDVNPSAPARTRRGPPRSAWRRCRCAPPKSTTARRGLVAVVPVVAHRCRRPRYASFRPEPHRVGGNAGPINDRLAGVNEPSVAGIRVGMCVEGARPRRERLGGCHHKWVAVVGPEMHDLALCNQVHVFSLATKGPDRETAPDRLG